MANNIKDTSSKSEKTLLTALLLSAPGPIVTGISVLLSFSTTQIADFLRRGTELVAIFVSWIIFRKLQRNKEIDDTEKTRLERLANMYVGGAMGSSGIIMLFIALYRLFQYKPSGNVIMGLVIAVLGLITNTWFWLRYRTLVREQFNAVIDAQQKLYRAKSYVDLCVVIALSAVAIAPAHPVARYVDIICSVIISFYLIWNGSTFIKKK
ncbi:MAG: cation transporter [Ruminiclostridium sp.]|nr:cation transporter [Ruminiclostridium sp.]